MNPYIKTFSEISIADIGIVGGKNASLGEMFSNLSSKGIAVPDGFATTAVAFEEFLSYNSLQAPLYNLMLKLDRKNYSNLKKTGAQARELIMDAALPATLKWPIIYAYENLCGDIYFEVAVRSSAIAEDFQHANFTGQHESYLNIIGEEALLNAVRKCYASLYTDRAIRYREDNGLTHEKAALSVGVQKLVRSDKASSGVAFTLEPESGFCDIIHISGVWGLSENMVQGKVAPDEFFVFKPTLKQGRNAIIQKNLGEKATTMIYGNDENNPVINIVTPTEKREQFVLSDEEVGRIAKWALIIEKHYQKPIELEWAKDGFSKDLFIIQARPEISYSQKNPLLLNQYQRLENLSCWQKVKQSVPK